MPANAAASSSAPRSFDVIVVGAGVVGAALAFSLARSGRRVAMLERDLAEPDRIVGELLQPGGVRALRLLGLADTLDGIDAVPVQGYQVFYGKRAVPIPYPQEAPEDVGRGTKSFSGKVEGRSFHHGRFVQSLRRRAQAHERVTTFEATVRELDEDADGRVVGVTATPKAEGDAKPEELVLKAPLTIVADGCFSKFRRTHGSTIAPTVRSNFVALELKNAPLPAPEHGHVVLGPAGPTLLYQISPTDTRVLVDVPGVKLPSQSKGELQAHIRDKVVAQLPEVLRPCVLEELERTTRFRSMPNSFLPPSMQGQNKQRRGVILVGDAMNMRHPLTGGGMSVGLWDVVHLTTSLGGEEWTPLERDAKQGGSRDLAEWDSLKPALRSWHWRRKGLASVINILAQALYSLFGADDENLEVLREGCFGYFELGGECVGGPVRLLSGLAPQPMLLVYHFFSVALYSIYTLFSKPRVHKGESEARVPGFLDWPALMWRSVAVFWTACVVLLPVVFTELRSNVPSFNRAASMMAPGEVGKKESRFNNVVLLVGLAAAAAYYVNGGAQKHRLSDLLVFPTAKAQSLSS